MKIISKFRDYYDSVSAYGVDTSIYFKRLQYEALYKKSSPWTSFKNNCRFNIELTPSILISSYQLGIIGFCGKLYPYVQVNFNAIGLTFLPNKDSVKFYYNFDKFYDEIYSKRKKDYGYKSNRDINNKRQKVKDFFDLTEYQDLYEIFIANNASIFNVSVGNQYSRNQDHILFNCQLDNYHFQEIKDPFTAYMDISNYMSGVLGIDESSMANISDESMKVAKGFDKWSFKTMPTKTRK